MNKLYCEQCNSIWYTSIERDDLTCDNCGAKLTKVDINSDNNELKKIIKND
ncbi:hypothetical protein [Oceanirhabdus sp. W0125-5]|uniref:hypothetical protein n=1 Tax=Oceanirhabdus sp. W0125-5 TaxID=2999116 RepID=UPI0022F3209E|nr:hypothetical protein [Oceanirhabdus sp. W0125-5]WBW95740.1 hypothetical protein OW730_18860 [Oceanirhabdus sp. W0125-5]